MEFVFFGFFPKSMCKIDDERATNHTERRRECTRLHSFTFPWPAFVAVNITLGIKLQARALWMIDIMQQHAVEMTPACFIHEGLDKQ